MHGQTYGYLPSRSTLLPRDWYHTKLYCLVTEAHVCEQLAQGDNDAHNMTQQ